MTTDDDRMRHPSGSIFKSSHYNSFEDRASVDFIIHALQIPQFRIKPSISHITWYNFCSSRFYPLDDRIRAVHSRPSCRGRQYRRRRQLALQLCRWSRLYLITGELGVLILMEMMTSSDGNIFSVTGWPFVRGIHRSPVLPSQMPMTWTFDVFLSVPE